MNKLAELGWGQENPAFRQFFTTQFIPGGSPEQHHWFNELERISTSPQNAGRFMRVFNDINVVDLLPQVTCPTLVLHFESRRARAVRRRPADRRTDPRRALRAARKAATTCCSTASRAGSAGSMSSARSCRRRLAPTRRSRR